MEKYQIAVQETYVALVEIEAEDLDDAKNKAYDAYMNGEVDMSQGDSDIEVYEW